MPLTLSQSDQIYFLTLEIVERFGFKEAEDKLTEKILEALSRGDIEKEKELTNQLPGKIISEILEQYFLAKIPPFRFPEVLEKELKISKEKARKMADFILRRIGERTLKEELPPEKPPRKKVPKRVDIYREPIE